jgi:hypothetical protein
MFPVEAAASQAIATVLFILEHVQCCLLTSFREQTLCETQMVALYFLGHMWSIHASVDQR